MSSGSNLSIVSFIFFGWLISISSICLAEVEITDPNQDLQRPPFSGNAPDFSKAFQCGESVPFFWKMGQCKIHCENNLCEQDCGWEEVVETKFQTNECTADQVMLYSTRNHEIAATSIDYQNSSNSIALTILKSVSAFYEHVEKIQVESIFLGIRKGLIENGKMRPVNLTSIVLAVYPNRTTPYSATLHLHLDLSQTGLHQVIYLSEIGACDPNQHYLIKRKGLVNAQF